MSTLVWDEVAKRNYETGVDRAVLYLPNGSAVPWNGLTSLSENSNNEVSSIYYEGRKISEDVTVGDFSGTLSALTYPEEFLELEGFSELHIGFYAGNQKPKLFGLSYRTKVGNDQTEDAGYKIHILYNATAVPNEKSFSTISDTISLTEFQWNITAIPVDFPGIRPTAYFVIDTRDISPFLVADLEELLYGSDTTDARLPSILELFSFIDTWRRIYIIDNGDGSWSAITEDPSVIDFIDSDLFSITSDTIVFLDSDTYTISDSD